VRIRFACTGLSFQKAIDDLESLLLKLDGDPTPGDWMIPSTERDDLVADITLAIDWLILELP